MDHRTREWTPAELEILEVLADAAMREVELRAAAIELERLNRFKSEMVRFAGHELRSPLAGIIGALDIVEMELPESADREMLELARNSGHRLLRLINDLLDAEHLESGAIPVQPVARSWMRSWPPPATACARPPPSARSRSSPS